jgi:hypothetical protein
MVAAGFEPLPSAKQLQVICDVDLTTMQINPLPDIGVILRGALDSSGEHAMHGIRTVLFVSVPPPCFDDLLVDNCSEMTYSFQTTSSTSLHPHYWLVAGLS